MCSHLWITDQALKALPQGELRQMLSREDVNSWLRAGSIFPDGGYGVDDAYGEMAHWEPLQAEYMQWILQEYPDPTADEALPHVAFWLGMASHGMADQVYDSLYLERAEREDAASDWESLSVDQATDVALVAEVGEIEIPAELLPPEALVEVFARQGHEVSPSTLEQGQGAARIAVWFVQEAAGVQDTVDEYAAHYPWASAHQLDPAVRGNPPDEAAVVAAYWQELWSRLHGAQAPASPLLATFPADGEWGQQTSAQAVPSWVTLVFARRLLEAPGEHLSVGEHPVEPWLYYRSDSHVVHLLPQEDWADNADYQVLAQAGVEFADGWVLDQDLTFGFSTAPPPQDTGDDEVTEGCGCSSVGATGALWLPLLLLGWRRR